MLLPVFAAARAWWPNAGAEEQEGGSTAAYIKELVIPFSMTITDSRLSGIANVIATILCQSEPRGGS